MLELGAGGGLPSLICAISGARKVVVTDYPDVDLVENLRFNISHCDLFPPNASIVAEGYLWGEPTAHIKSHLRDPASAFDLLILADIIYSHSEHQKLISTITVCLKSTPGARALVFFTPYRPWLLQKDLSFFNLATAHGFVVKKILETKIDRVMFERDPGDETLRRTVFGYELKWPLR